MKKFIWLSLLIPVVVLAQGSGTPSQLRVRTDANGYLVTASGTQTLPLSQPTTFNQIRLRTDANGYLLVVVDGLTSFPTLTGDNIFTGENTFQDVVDIIPQLNITVDNGLGITPLIVQRNAVGYPVDVDGIRLENITAATAGVTRQEPAKYIQCGQGWNTNSLASNEACFSFSVVPNPGNPVEGEFQINFHQNGSFEPAKFTVNSSGSVGSSGAAGFASLDLTGSGQAGANSGNIVIPNTNDKGLYWSSRVTLTTALDKFFLTNEGVTSGQEMNVGVPALGTCTDGSLTAGSHNFAGEVTGNTSSSCVINFGTDWTNTPFCQVESESSLTHPRISASSASSITVTGTVSGESFTYICMGRIGT